MASALKRHILSHFQDQIVKEIPVDKDILMQFGLSSAHAAHEDDQRTDAVAFSIAHAPQLLFHEFYPVVDEFSRQRGGRCDVMVDQDSFKIFCINYLPGVRTVLIQRTFLCYHVAILNTG